MFDSVLRLLEPPNIRVCCCFCLLVQRRNSASSVQSTHALLCVGAWSLLGYIKDEDVKATTVMPEVKGEEEELATNWDSTV